MSLILLIAACILFILAAFGVGGKINLVAAGLACWVLSALLNGTSLLRAVALAGFAAMLCSCAADGTYDAAATESAIRTIGSAYDTGSRAYRDYRSGYKSPPAVVAPVAQPLPVYPSVYP